MGPLEMSLRRAIISASSFVVTKVYTLTVSSDQYDYKIADALAAAHPDYVNYLQVDVTVNIAPGVVLGASNAYSMFGLDTGEWSNLKSLRINIGSGAYVVGAGGTGQVYPVGHGGDAFRARVPAAVDNQGVIGGGGGAGANPFGGVSFAGGGAGRIIGETNAQAAPATLTTGGEGNPGYADGGDLGQQGQPDQGFPGGLAGYAVQGISNVTWINQGTVLGPTTG